MNWGGVMARLTLKMIDDKRHEDNKRYHALFGKMREDITIVEKEVITLRHNQSAIETVVGANTQAMNLLAESNKTVGEKLDKFLIKVDRVKWVIIGAGVGVVLLSGGNAEKTGEILTKLIGAL